MKLRERVFVHVQHANANTKYRAEAPLEKRQVYATLVSSQIRAHRAAPSANFTP